MNSLCRLVILIIGSMLLPLNIYSMEKEDPVARWDLLPLDIQRHIISYASGYLGLRVFFKNRFSERIAETNHVQPFKSFKADFFGERYDLFLDTRVLYHTDKAFWLGYQNSLCSQKIITLSDKPTLAAASVADEKVFGSMQSGGIFCFDIRPPYKKIEKQEKAPIIDFVIDESTGFIFKNTQLITLGSDWTISLWNSNLDLLKSVNYAHVCSCSPAAIAAANDTGDQYYIESSNQDYLYVNAQLAILKLIKGSHVGLCRMPKSTHAAIRQESLEALIQLYKRGISFRAYCMLKKVFEIADHSTTRRPFYMLDRELALLATEVHPALVEWLKKNNYVKVCVARRALRWANFYCHLQRGGP